ncbi:MAG: carboxylesterase [Legionellales bacterium]|nr:carboxylesterase [Legionellales bacterium]
MNEQEIIIHHGSPIHYAVIWLHGLGADGHDFASIVPELRLPSTPGIRFIFPHAPVRPITINNGFAMRGWYDISGFDLNARVDREGILASELMIQQLITTQIEQGIPANNIVLAGFSQGGAMALHTGLRFPEKLAGILALSCYLPLPADIPLATSDETAILQIHGVYDPIVPLKFGELSRDQLQKLNYRVDWQTFAMEHSVCAEEIRMIGDWLVQTLYSR